MSSLLELLMSAAAGKPVGTSTLGNGSFVRLKNVPQNDRPDKEEPCGWVDEMDGFIGTVGIVVGGDEGHVNDALGPVSRVWFKDASRWFSFKNVWLERVPGHRDEELKETYKELRPDEHTMDDSDDDVPDFASLLRHLSQRQDRSEQSRTEQRRQPQQSSSSDMYVAERLGTLTEMLRRLEQDVQEIKRRLPPQAS